MSREFSISQIPEQIPSIEGNESLVTAVLGTYEGITRNQLVAYRGTVQTSKGPVVKWYWDMSDIELDLERLSVVDGGWAHILEKVGKISIIDDRQVYEPVSGKPRRKNNQNDGFVFELSTHHFTGSIDLIILGNGDVFESMK